MRHADNRTRSSGYGHQMEHADRGTIEPSGADDLRGFLGIYKASRIDRTRDQEEANWVALVFLRLALDRP